MSMLRDQDMIFVRRIWVRMVEEYNVCMVEWCMLAHGWRAADEMIMPFQAWGNP